MARKLLFTAILLVAGYSLSACASSLTYVIMPMTARVVDADTGRPLESVVVVAHWELERGTVGGNVPADQLKVMETVTDKDGKFSFLGFGPESVRDSFLVDKDPELIVFKSGYKYRRLLNKYSSDRELRTRRERRSDWNGKVIALQKFAGTPEQWFRMLERVIPPYNRGEAARRSLILKAVLAEENRIPDSVSEKQPFFDNIVRWLLEERRK